MYIEEKSNTFENIHNKEKFKLQFKKRSLQNRMLQM